METGCNWSLGNTKHIGTENESWIIMETKVEPHTLYISNNYKTRKTAVIKPGKRAPNFGGAL